MKQALFIVMVLFLAACTVTAEPSNTITMYKSPTCGCCVGWAAHMKANGYAVEPVNVEDMSLIKQQFAIPAGKDSCHTALIDGYVVEGHIPADVVDDMLTVRPAIDGIALPRMPAGSPGMPGTKSGLWTIYSFSGGETEEYVRV